MGNLVFAAAAAGAPPPAAEPASPALKRHASIGIVSDAVMESHVVKECSPLLLATNSPPPLEEGGRAWEDVFQDGERLKVWRRQHPSKPGAFEYALRGKTKHSPHVFFSTALQDINFRLEWDESCGDARVLSFCRNTRIETLYWVTKYPWPVAERDYIFHRKLSSNRETGAYHGVSWVGTRPPYEDEAHAHWDLKDLREEEVNARAKQQGNGNRVRVSDYATTMLVLPTPDGGAIWALRVLDDPKVSFIPPQVLNWIVSKTLPSSAAKLDKACEARMNAGDK